MSPEKMWKPQPGRLERRQLHRSCGSRILATATVLVPLWESATWWGLVVPDGGHFSEEVVDWVWLPRDNPNLFVPGSTPGGQEIVQPVWPSMAVRVDFSAGGDHIRIPLRIRCIHGGCDACRLRSWYR